MFGKNPRLNPRAAQKELLIAESELNRAQLVWDGQALAHEVRALTHQAQTIASLASAAATLVAGFVSLRRKKSVAVAGRYSWLQALLQGSQTARSLWSKFRPASCDSDAA